MKNEHRSSFVLYRNGRRMMTDSGHTLGSKRSDSLRQSDGCGESIPQLLYIHGVSSCDATSIKMTVPLLQESAALPYLTGCASNRLGQTRSGAAPMNRAPQFRPP